MKFNPVKINIGLIITDNAHVYHYKDEVRKSLMSKNRQLFVIRYIKNRLWFVSECRYENYRIMYHGKKIIYNVHGCIVRETQYVTGQKHGHTHIYRNNKLVQVEKYRYNEIDWVMEI